VGYAQGDACHVEVPETLDIPLDKLSLKGKHNLRNCLSAILAASSAGVGMDVIIEALGDFPGVEHRLEFVRTVDGVTYINDSKATNVDACYCALDSMKTPVVLIIGGKDKGNDYSEIEQLVNDKVKAIVCMGVDNTPLHAFFDGKVSYIVDAGSMQEAVAKAYAAASPGDTVLLSPCCASFDLFKSYEDRGAQFKECVRNL
jgi:UDP-N-acetylmuramoylalanine--D-glutamate ligase